MTWCAQITQIHTHPNKRFKKHKIQFQYASLALRNSSENSQLAFLLLSRTNFKVFYFHPEKNNLSRNLLLALTLFLTTHI